VVLRVLGRGHDANLNVAAARLHVLGDLLGSVAACTAAIVILTSGWTPIDPLLSVLVALLILRSAAMLLAQSTRALLTHPPSPGELAARTSSPSASRIAERAPIGRDERR
jgi:cobalt-zinc-cadmium efflux system protein